MSDAALPRAVRRLCISCTFVLATTVRAGPPYQTDDPEPVAPGKYEINIATQETLTSSGRTGTLPGVEINYGGAPNLQLHLALPLAFANPASGGKRLGPGDVELGAKYRILQETNGSLMLAVYPTYFAATGDAGRGLGHGGSQLLLPVWAQKSFGPWTVDAGVGYLINRASGGRDSVFAGWLLQRRMTARLVIGAELFRRTRTADDVPDSAGFNVGATYDFDERYHLLFSVGRGLLHPQQTNQLSSYVALQITD